MQSLIVIAYVVAPFMLLRVHKVWGVLLAILTLWLPIEFGLLGWFGVSSTLAVALGVLTGLFVFRSRRDVLNASLAFNLSHFEPQRSLVSLLLFAVVAIPLGITPNFIRFTFNPEELTGLPLLFVTIFLFNALPEEILFRGMIQNWIENRAGSFVTSLIVSSVIFGAAHLNNGPPIPNYKYFLLAGIASLFYGIAWHGRKNVLTSTLTHTLVNVGWSLFFR